MIKIENTEVCGWETAIKYIRNLKDNCGESDSGYCLETLACHSCRWNRKTEVNCKKNINKHSFVVGKNDLKLMKTIAQGGTDLGDFLEMINITIDITAPLYWWSELNRYISIPTLSNINMIDEIKDKTFTIDDFSHEHLGIWRSVNGGDIHSGMIGILKKTIENLNYCRNRLLETQEKKWLWQIQQLLPASYNEKRKIQLNYATLLRIYEFCQNHKLDEWRNFCDWILSLPYFKEICLED